MRASPVISAAAAVLVGVSSMAGAAGQPPPKILLTFDQPLFLPLFPLPLMFSSGWPMVLRAVATPSALGIALNFTPDDFPTAGDTAYVVFEDPDGCLRLPPPFFADQQDPNCAGKPSDETYMEFTNDIDQVGVDDAAGNPALRAALGDPTQTGEPVFSDLELSSSGLVPVQTSVGPTTGGNVADGIGYGASDDWPSLVLLSPRGVGLVLDADLNAPPIRTQRNLAGFLNWVSYELKNPIGATVVSGGMMVPYGLIAPIVKVDECVGAQVTPGICDQPLRYRMDGGPIQNAAPGQQPFFPEAFLYMDLFNALQYELRAFVVSGIAPSKLADMNGNGTVTAADATLAGYKVISNEAVIRLRQFHGDVCGGASLDNRLRADFDGNGLAFTTFVCPAGPGQIKKPPQ